MQATNRMGRVGSLFGLVAGLAAKLSRRSKPRTLYQVLGVPPDADGDSVKAAYRTLARRLHPDLNPGDAASAQRLAEINNAYETLADPDTRAAYDRDLAQQRAAARRRIVAVGAVSTVTFTVTTGLVSHALRRHLEPAPGGAWVAHVTEARGTPGSEDGGNGGGSPGLPDVTGPAGISDPVPAPIWRTYHDPRFNFSLRYPAGIFILDSAHTNAAANIRTFVSHDGRATLRIVASENTAGVTLAGLRRGLMKERYAGASFDRAPRSRHWFALSGTRGDKVFLERITFSCDGKAMHGWQMLYPSSQRATYDEIAKLVLRNHPHGNGPTTGCGEARPTRTKAASRRKG